MLNKCNYSYLASGSFVIKTTPVDWKEMFYLTTHSTHFIYAYMASASGLGPVQDHSITDANQQISFFCVIKVYLMLINTIVLKALLNIFKNPL